MSTIYRSEAGAQVVERRYRELLGTWPVPAEERRVPTREGDTFVLVSGPVDAPPLVLLHGSGANAATWLGDIASWAQHFRTYAVDMVGEPGFSAPSRPDLKSEAVALWLDDVLTGLGLTSTAVVGMSLGGWTALDYAIRRPERITRLALQCPGGIGKQRFGWMFKSIALHLVGRSDQRASTRLVTGLDKPEFEPVLDDVILTFEHFKPRTGRLPMFTDTQLHGLAMPVLVIVGARDVMFDSTETARRVRENVPDATVRVLPDVGHAILGQTDTVLNFLRG
ncbi:alpha/beta fold hydrolase [Nocardia uniformis]|uniref:Alpha/beta fold hydrolase n=1 Tax=Nocardia uniformis TaxID=53432 RepID=A0A849CL12_9NOCA|nr:alpha/beta fold hydrolase [Nocardia uniformis]NNH75991.1 alpha/beta fold hydrolase [Nocardia uniformis]